MGRSKQPSSVLASKYFCSVPNCSETFTKLANLRRHTKNVHETVKKSAVTYQCDVDGCGKIFRKRKQLYDHKFVTHNQERKEKYACPHCSAKFAVPSKLNVHSKRHEGYPCPQCDFRAETWSALRRHKADIHPTEYKCQQCDKKFTKKYYLKKHQRLHERVVKCPEAKCDVMVLPWKLAKHVKTTHLSSLPDGRQLHQIDDIIAAVLRDDPPLTPRTFECTDCGKTFAKERNLRLHRRNLHSGSGKSTPTRQPTFACSIQNCTRRFLTEAKLQAHLNCHLGVQPFKCPENGCVAKFAGRSALQRHVKWKHMKMLQQYELIQELATIRAAEETESDGEDEESDTGESSTLS